MTSRLRDVLKSKSPGQKLRILKKLLSEQSAHINFLSEQLYGQMNQNGADSSAEEYEYCSSEAESDDDKRERSESSGAE